MSRGFGLVSAQMVNIIELGDLRASANQFRPMLANRSQMQPMWADASPMLIVFRQCWPSWAKVRPSVPRFGPLLVNIGETRRFGPTKCVRNLPTLVRDRQARGYLSVSMGAKGQTNLTRDARMHVANTHVSDMCSRFRFSSSPIVGLLEVVSTHRPTKCGPFGASAATWGRIGQVCAELDGPLPNFGGVWRRCARFVLLSSRCCPKMLEKVKLE